MTLTPPYVIVVAGCNGSGKSTTAPALVSGRLNLANYINPDLIARGLAPRDQSMVSLAAGRIVLRRIDELSARRESFAFETTLSGKNYLRLLSRLNADGYQSHLVFLWLNEDDLAVKRVAKRVEDGGHNIPEPDIRRRYTVGLRNLFRHYRYAVHSWELYDNSSFTDFGLIAFTDENGKVCVRNVQIWQMLESKYSSL